MSEIPSHLARYFEQYGVGDEVEISERMLQSNYIGVFRRRDEGVITIAQSSLEEGKWVENDIYIFDSPDGSLKTGVDFEWLEMQVDKFVSMWMFCNESSKPQETFTFFIQEDNGKETRKEYISRSV